MGSSNSKKTNEAIRTGVKEQSKLPDAAIPDQVQQDPTKLKKESTKSVIITNQIHHQTTGTVQSLQKQRQQGGKSLNDAPKPSVVFSSEYRFGKASTLKTKQIKKHVIAAIEIGYTHSGYVFCLGKQFALEGGGLYCPNWEAKDKGVVTFKTSSAILFRPDKSIHSIGYEAEEHVSRIQCEPDSGKWFFSKLHGGAGIKQDQLTFVQGPEAELKYHRTFTSSPSTFGEEQIAPLSKNFRSLLIHLGGVAIDLTVIEIKVTVRVPPRWYDAYEERTGDTLTNTINQTAFKESVEFQNDKIRMSPELFRKFNENATEFTTEMVEKTLAKHSASGIGILFIAGDHVDDMFVNKLKKQYPSHRIIVSKNPELVVLKGAVLCEIVE
ncbi:unnamed protein product [Mytilus edulis]|uniref:Uncharacterized protein n=1 Tax=Mytilus edulis TaxID=6550 RepID=A0A8S3RNX7_MYTED|nr:unnamed protein product [Mytilus edulis]